MSAGSGGGGVWDWITSIPMANVIAFGAGLPGALLAFWTFSVTRKDKRTTEERQSQADRTKELRAQEQGILQWTQAELAECRLQVGRNETTYRKQLIETEDERDLWEARARWWYRLSDELHKQLGDARHLAGNYEAIVKGLGAEHIIESMDIPKLPASRPRLPNRIEDIQEQT